MYSSALFRSRRLRYEETDVGYDGRALLDDDDDDVAGAAAAAEEEEEEEQEEAAAGADGKDFLPFFDG